MLKDFYRRSHLTNYFSELHSVNCFFIDQYYNIKHRIWDNIFLVPSKYFDKSH